MSSFALPSLLRNAPFGIQIADTEGNTVHVNRAAVQIHGWDAEDIPTVGVAFEKMYPDPEMRQAALEDWYGALEHADPSQPGPILAVRCKDGSTRHVQFSWPVAMRDGHVLVFLMDVTERIRARRALARSERNLRALVDSARTFVVYRFAPDLQDLARSKVEVVSPSVRDVLGIEETDDLSAWFARVHPEDLPTIRQRVERSVTDGMPFDEVYRLWHAPREEWRWLHGLGQPVHDDSGELVGLTGVIIDITEHHRAQQDQEKLQRQVARMQRLEALGTLAGGVAHDFNNLLMAIGGNVELALQSGDPAGVRYALQRIQEQVDSGRALTRQLLGYARQDVSERTPFDLCALVRNTAALFQRTHKDLGVQLELEPPCLVEGDRAQLERVILNLLLNAADALDDQGRIRIGTRTRGDEVTLEVRDEGAGMDAETLERAFEPFFTTKEPGRGTGLGLSASYGIVQGHEGAIVLESEPGQGTRVQVTLPRTDRAPTKGRAPEALSGTGRLLVIEDEEQVRTVLEQLLQSLGYQPTSFAEGRGAVQWFAEHASEVDAVVLDMVLPDLGGRAIFEELRARSPQVPVVISSGYSADQRAAELVQEPRVAFLQKPFSRAALSEALHAAMGT